MAAPTFGRRAGTAAAALVLALSGVLIPAASALAAVVNPASGGAAISADLSGTSSWTHLSGPAIAESNLSELTGTTILNVPSGFRFNPQSGSLGIGGKDCDLKARLKVTSTQATLTVTQTSSIGGCIVTFVGLQVQPTSGQALASGNIVKTGTSSAPGGGTSYGMLTEVPGAVTELLYLTQPSATNAGGTAFGTQPVILARDQFGNNVANASVTLSITPGTGASGAHLKCATNPVRTSGSGIAAFAGCRIDRVGRYKLRAAKGHAARNSGNFNVVVGTATKLVFKAYPGATTKSTLSTQPRVAVTDAGGNTVTTYPATDITIAINKHASTFSCTGGLSATTVHGVAQFRGCKQKTVGTGYQLYGLAGFAITTGKVFKVR